MKKIKIHPLLIAFIWAVISGLIAINHVEHDCVWGWIFWTAIPGIVYGIGYDMEHGGF